ncbi:GNAT superfamily N-acetyltransferase [Sphingomonas sp. SORGH_AS 950]|uniref:GNAT family N-acetyltransferase n=1 Tax=unclassified Sphingomonas TaxID=196159 RepID=UPI00278B30A2|nr:GNAT family N-acetyltransferase [Sphingomonas sp. SORGH_AS_0950]MDQ1159001.1 GNAT superfamily N-acetyltransferase [Sphingomonas sp. SORGH_AS_0950]
MITIRAAAPDDAEALTNLMHGSASYSGKYASILDGYAVTPSQIERDVFYIAERDDTLCGFYSLTLDGEPELDLMFVADGIQGSGLGSRLFRHMMAEARRRGIVSIKIVSHPPSVGFYEAMGAVVVGTKPPTIKATWSRPILSLAI